VDEPSPTEAAEGRGVRKVVEGRELVPRAGPMAESDARAPPDRTTSSLRGHSRVASSEDVTKGRPLGGSRCRPFSFPGFVSCDESAGRLLGNQTKWDWLRNKANGLACPYFVSGSD